MNKREKGEYGYRGYLKKLQTGMVLLGVAAILIQLGARHFIENQDFKNILTVMAVLSVLPMANLASPLLASWRYKTLEKGLYDVFRSFEDRCLMIYELVITSREQIIPVEAAAIHSSGIYLYIPLRKLNWKKAEEFLREELEHDRSKLPVSIIREETEFLERLEALKQEDRWQEDIELTAASRLLKRLAM